MLSGGKHAAQTRAGPDFAGGRHRCRDEEIARTVRLSASTIYRTKRRSVLSEEPRPGGGALADRQGGSAAGGDRLPQAAHRPEALDAGAARRRNGQAHQS